MIALFLFERDFIFKYVDNVAFVSFVSLSEQKCIDKTSVDFLDIFGLQRFQIVEKSIKKLWRRIVVPRDDLEGKEKFS